MNLLYSIVGRDYHEMVINKIKRHFSVKNQIAISELWNVRKKDFSAIYEFSDVYFGRYYKYKEYDLLKPVDDALLMKMNPEALETIKMMDRPYTWETGFEERFQLYLKHLCFWNSVLDLYEIDYAIFFNVPHEVFDFVIYTLCKKKGIKTVVLFDIPRDLFKNRAFVSENFNKEWKNIANCLSEGNFDSNIPEAIAQYEKYHTACTDVKANTPAAKKNWVNHSSMIDNLNAMCFYEIRTMVEAKYKNEINVRKVNAEIEDILTEKKHRRLKNRLYKRVWKENERRIECYESLACEPVKGEKYIYFALHYQPEATSSPWGGGLFTNQLIPIKMICGYLPKGYKLYVKEHPSQTHIGRDNSLYNEIAAIKNARLISLKADNIDLIRSAAATATLTGTTAMESVLNGVPCITFGEYIYNALEGCFHVRSNEECENAIKRIVSGFKIDQNKVRDFFCVIYQNSIPANVGYGSYNMVKNAEIVSDKLIEEMERGR